MKKILLYVHYNKEAALHAHVLYQLEKLRDIYERVVFVSNSPLSSTHKHALSPFVDDFLERANVGFDFYAWKEAIVREGFEKLSSYDSVTLMNDTCFGPLFDLESAYQKMALDPCDFWGMINHRRGEEIIPELGIKIPEHAQSYFLVFKSRVVGASAWRTFWEQVECETSVYQVIAKYEVQLTVVLREAGFNYKVLLDSLDLDLSREELSYVPADYCIADRLPLLKIKSLLQHRNPRHIIGEIFRLSDYPVWLIEDYISRELQPDKSILYCDKVLDASSTPASIQPDARQASVALHVHVFYIDVWARYLDYLQALEFPFALYITTDGEEKADEVRALFQGRHIGGCDLKAILVLPNRGRDVLPWLSISDELSGYDFVLHAHTKRSPTAVGWVGASWQQEIFDTMLVQASNILCAFEADPSLGVVIPDVPRFWRYISPTYRATEVPYLSIMKDLWSRMGCSKKADFDNAQTFIMPYGTMFWYRPAALRRMTSLVLEAEDVADEPLPKHTALHALERLVVYVAWGAGFDYKIVPPKEMASGFVDAIVRNQLCAQAPFAGAAMQHTLPEASGGGNGTDMSIFTHRVIAKLKQLARPKKLIKMLMPYGMVRVYQKMDARRRARSQSLPGNGVTSPLPMAAGKMVASPVSQGPFIKSKDYWLRTHRHLQPLNIVRDAGAPKRLNLVISSLGRAQLFGGIATCTAIATMLARALGLPLRVIARDGAATLGQYLEIMSTMGVEPCADISFYSDASRDDIGGNCPPVYSSDSDIFLASSWWTATALRQGVEHKRVYHIIQEDELMFYQRGDDYLDCLNALNAPDSKYIVNSHYLHAWFKDVYPQVYENSVVFDPVFTRAFPRKFQEKKKYNLFFYARLTNPRNLFWFGVRIIDDCLKSGILDPDEWNIFLAGDDSIPQIEFYGGKKAVNLGILGWDEYGSFLQDVDLGLCLIHTPHPGYPVYDVASSGGVAVTNTLYTKDSFPNSANIIACDLSEGAFAQGMAKAVALAKNGVMRGVNYGDQMIPSSWSKSLAGVIEFMKAA